MKQLFFLPLLFVAAIAYGQQKVIPLYQGQAPGSEKWTWKERLSETNSLQTKLVFNVVTPTLTVFPAQGPLDTGTAVIIAPGGAFLMLSIDSEGNDIAAALSKRGITAFVLKYRLIHTREEEGYIPIREFMALTKPVNGDSIGPAATLAKSDGLAAVAYVRQHAAAYKINPNRIGLMGFSAGGSLTMSVAYGSKDESRPNFIAPIYPFNKGIIGSVVPQEKMPAFIAVASDDVLRLVPTSIDIYTKWRAAKQPAELHIYQAGGHGFGSKKQGLASDVWLEHFEEWLQFNGWLK